MRLRASRFHIAFSLDNGHTWQDRVSFSDLPVTDITGQVDMAKVGPRTPRHRRSSGGTKVFPVTVERVESPSNDSVDLTGRISDAGGRPIAGATIDSWPNRYTTEYRPIAKDAASPRTKADSEGAFVFEDIEPGERVLTVEAEGYAPAWRRLDLRRGFEPVQVTLEPGRVVTGQVVDEEGKPVEGACVILDGDRHVHTDTSGAFSWIVEGRAPEKITVHVVKCRFLQQLKNRTAFGTGETGRRSAP